MTRIQTRPLTSPRFHTLMCRRQKRQSERLVRKHVPDVGELQNCRNWGKEMGRD